MTVTDADRRHFERVARLSQQNEAAEMRSTAPAAGMQRMVEGLELGGQASLDPAAEQRLDERALCQAEFGRRARALGLWSDG